MAMDRDARVFTGWVLSGMVTAIFLISGVMKLAGAAEMVAAFARFGLPQWSLIVCGICEIAGAILILFPRFVFPAAVSLLAITIAALLAHLFVGELVTAPVLVAVSLLVVIWLRR